MNDMEEKQIEAQLDDILIEAVDELNSQLDDGGRLDYDNKETVLLGKGSSIDSMTFVTLTVIIEDLIFEKLGKTVKIVSAKAFSEKSSPFRNFGTLKEFIAGLLAG